MADLQDYLSDYFTGCKKGICIQACCRYGGRVTCFKGQAIHAQNKKGGEYPSFFYYCMYLKNYG